MRFICAVPALNEESCLENTVRNLREFFDGQYPHHHFTLIIADNGSNDATKHIGEKLKRTVPGVEYQYTPYRGKGRAIQNAWKLHEADACFFTDADLAYGLNTVGHVINALAEGAPIVSASRFVDGSSEHQPFLRKIISRTYNKVLSILFPHQFTDAQAGCKGVQMSMYQTLAPHLIEETGWFFDTHLLLLAEKYGHTIYEVPAENVDPRPSLPKLSALITLPLGLLRLRLFGLEKK
ncbi:MAG: glycosyltransferase [Patescibacteria group bacterium UBA2163]